jgi:hypothetical protein
MINYVLAVNLTLAFTNEFINQETVVGSVA